MGDAEESLSSPRFPIDLIAGRGRSLSLVPFGVGGACLPRASQSPESRRRRRRFPGPFAGTAI